VGTVATVGWRGGLCEVDPTGWQDAGAIDPDAVTGVEEAEAKPVAGDHVAVGSTEEVAVGLRLDQGRVHREALEKALAGPFKVVPLEVAALLEDRAQEEGAAAGRVLVLGVGGHLLGLVGIVAGAVALGGDEEAADVARGLAPELAAGHVEHVGDGDGGAWVVGADLPLGDRHLVLQADEAVKDDLAQKRIGNRLGRGPAEETRVDVDVIGVAFVHELALVGDRDGASVAASARKIGLDGVVDRLPVDLGGEHRGKAVAEGPRDRVVERGERGLVADVLGAELGLGHAVDDGAADAVAAPDRRHGPLARALERRGYSLERVVDGDVGDDAGNVAVLGLSQVGNK